ncbi:unnamed protein product, partial [marine sediment metagenome]
MGLTGPGAEEGQETYNGIELAAKQRKKILGHPIKLYVGDAPTPSQAITETKRLITTKNVLCILGSTTKGNAKAVPPICQKYGVPVLEFEWDPELTEQGWKRYFRIGQSYAVYVESVADRVVDYFAPMLGKKPEELRLAVVYDGWSKPVIKLLLDYLKEKYGIEPVYLSENPWDTSDFTAVIEQLKAQEPIDIFLPEQIVLSAIIFRKQAIMLGFKPKITFGMGVGWGMPEFPDALGTKNVEGIFVYPWPIPEMNFKPAREFGEAYKK